MHDPATSQHHRASIARLPRDLFGETFSRDRVSVMGQIARGSGIAVRPPRVVSRPQVERNIFAQLAGLAG
jgi:hypothetical protein